MTNRRRKAEDRLQQRADTLRANVLNGLRTEPDVYAAVEFLERGEKLRGPYVGVRAHWTTRTGAVDVSTLRHEWSGGDPTAEVGIHVTQPIAQLDDAHFWRGFEADTFRAIKDAIFDHRRELCDAIEGPAAVTFGLWPSASLIPTWIEDEGNYFHVQWTIPAGGVAYPIPEPAPPKGALPVR